MLEKQIFVRHDISGVSSGTNLLDIKRIIFYNERKSMTEKGDYLTNPDMIDWYKNNGANVRYTGTYWLPIKPTISRIFQGFYGSYSHAGSFDFDIQYKPKPESELDMIDYN